MYYQIACFFRDESNDDNFKAVSPYWFLAPFLLRGLTWAKLCASTENHPKNCGTCVLAFPFNSYLKIKFFKIIGLNPLPPPLNIPILSHWTSQDDVPH